MSDALTEALNSPSGNLAVVVLRRLSKGPGSDEIPDDISRRLDRLVEAKGEAGRLARVCLASEVSYLFDRAPKWTSSKLVPIFDWSSPDAAEAWDSRKYTPYIGSSELFLLTKQPFLEMFGRNDIATDDLRTFAEWLVALLIVNRSHTGASYALEATEARAALRKAGVDVLSAVAHRLANEMSELTPDEGAKRWRTIIGPVFNDIWPLDVELQSNASNFAFVQILTSAGAALSEATEAIIPFIRPDDPRKHTTIFSIAEAPDSFYEASPAKVLDLLAAIVGDASPRSFFNVDTALSKIRSIAPHLSGTRKFQKLMA
jgi:hypothetical protein